MLLSVVLATALFFYQGTPTHALDWSVHLLWMQSYADAMAYGEFPPRWVEAANAGYGAPVFMFYAPLVYLLATPWVWLDSASTALLVSYTQSFLLLAWFSYRWLRVYSNRMGACMGAMFLVLSPWTLGFAYRWNMPAGLLAFALMPLLLWRFERLRTSTRQRFVSAGIAYALICLTHLPSAFMLTLWLLLRLGFDCVQSRSVRPAIPGLLSLALGTTLAAFYVGPAVLERNLVHSNYAISDIWQWQRHVLFQSNAQHEGIMAFLPLFEYMALLLCALIAYACFIHIINKRPLLTSGIQIPVAMCVTGLVLMTALSGFIYSHWEAMRFLQFPWRWMWLPTLGAAIALSTLISKQHHSRGFFHNLGLIGISLVLLPYLAISASVLGFNVIKLPIPDLVWTTPDSARAASRYALHDTFEHRPISMINNWNQDMPIGDHPRITATPDTARFTPITLTPHERAWRIYAATSTTIRLRLFDYPGWSAWLDEKPVLPLANKGDGTLRFELLSGTHVLRLQFSTTPARQIFGWISVLASLGILLFWLRKKTQRKQIHKT
jgi:uncharacterized membrane protein